MLLITKYIHTPQRWSTSVKWTNVRHLSARIDEMQLYNAVTHHNKLYDVYNNAFAPIVETWMFIILHSFLFAERNKTLGRTLCCSSPSLKTQSSRNTSWCSGNEFQRFSSFQSGRTFQSQIGLWVRTQDIILKLELRIPSLVLYATTLPFFLYFSLSPSFFLSFRRRTCAWYGDAYYSNKM